MLFFTFLSRHKLAGRFISLSRSCLRLWSLPASLLRTGFHSPWAVRLLTDERAHLYHKERAVLCALNHL